MASMRPYKPGEREFLLRSVSAWKTAADRRKTLLTWLKIYHGKTWFEFSGYQDPSVLLREVRKHHPSLVKEFNVKANSLFGVVAGYL